MKTSECALQAPHEELLCTKVPQRDLCVFSYRSVNINAIIFFIIFLVCVSVDDAHPQAQKKKTYNAYVYLMKGGKVKGALYQVHESSIEIKRKNGNMILPIENIRVIHVRRPHAAATGLLVGLGTGVVVGGIVGLATYQDTPNDSFLDFGPGLNMGVGMVIGALAGVIVGDAVGRKSYRVRIAGEQQNFEQHKLKLRQYQLLSGDQENQLSSN